MSYITIFTDASWCQQTGIGSWAAYIRYGDGEKFQINKPFKDVLPSSQQAEMKAVANSIAVALKLITPEIGDIILVQTDCQAVIEFVELKKPIKARPRNQEYRRLARVIREMIPAGVQLRFKKVKGHSNKEGVRSYCNKVVDKLSRKLMRKTRSESLTKVMI